jgi:hypothetical protein
MNRKDSPLAARANQLKGTRARTVTIFGSNGKKIILIGRNLCAFIHCPYIVIDAGLVIC